jgi:hypothetical protein
MRRVDGVFIIDVVRRFVNVMLTSMTLSVPEPATKSSKADRSFTSGSVLFCLQTVSSVQFDGLIGEQHVAFANQMIGG